MLYPLTFHPIFKERVWGGRKLQQLYHKPLPPKLPIGESWEISDRPDDASVIANGACVGKNLRWLMENHRAELLGPAKTCGGRFPLLVKIIDAQQKLSLQVHPPESVAARFGGEAKTEMWFIADAQPDSEIFAGLRQKTSREQFEKAIRDGTVADCFHRIPVEPGDAMFLPSGRVHAIGAGVILFEIQQNSDTTYRVFDWNRAGLDGKPRQLHVAEALASIDFNDFEPSPIESEFQKRNGSQIRPLVCDSLFDVEIWRLPARSQIPAPENKMQIIGILSGKLLVSHGQLKIFLLPGQFCLLPASLRDVVLQAEGETSFLRVEAGK